MTRGSRPFFRTVLAVLVGGRLLCPADSAPPKPGRRPRDHRARRRRSGAPQPRFSISTLKVGKAEEKVTVAAAIPACPAGLRSARKFRLEKTRPVGGRA